MNTSLQKLAAWASGMFAGIWLILLLLEATKLTLFPNWVGWTRWLFMLSTIMVGFFGGVATDLPITNWTKWVALGSVAVALHIFFALSFDYITSLSGIAGTFSELALMVSVIYTSWLGGYFIGAYLTRD